MKNKSGAVLLCALLMANGAILSACGSTQVQQNDKVATEDASNNSSSQQEGAEEADFVRNIDRFSVDGAIEETTLLDNDVITVIAKGLDYRDNTALLSVSITNKTKSPFTVLAATLSYAGNYVNDYMVHEGYINCDVAAGATEEEEISFSFQELETVGIKGVGEIGLGLRVTDEDSKELCQEIVSVKTSLDGNESIKSGSFSDVVSDPDYQKKMEFSIRPSVSIDQSIGDAGIDIQSAMLLTNKDDKTMLMLELENRTNEIVQIAESNISVDGIVVSEGRWSTTVIVPGKRALADTNLTYICDSEEDPIDLAAIKEVGLSLAIEDAKGNTILDPTEVTITF